MHPTDLKLRVAQRFVQEGCTQAIADSVAQALVRAEIEGQTGHGLRRLPSYIAQIRSHKLNPRVEPTMSEVAPGLVKIDAAGGFAYPALDLAVQALQDRAPLQGIAAAAISASHHCGVAGHPVVQLAESGCAAFLFANTPAAIAIAGGRSALLGTNPIAFAVPSGDGSPIVVDMSLSVVARGKIITAQQKGEEIPKGWAFNCDGHPTTSPDAALNGGTLAPIGGDKGAVLALMVELIAAGLTGSHYAYEASSFLDTKGGPPGTGQFIIAVSIDRLGGASIRDHIERFCKRIDAESGARRPGARSQKALLTPKDIDIPEQISILLE